jgi:hypothetical protein
METLTPEQKKARELARKRANYKAYYERHKEEMRERQRGRYNSDLKKAYYEAHKDEIRTYMKTYYKSKKGLAFAQRLDALITRCEAEPAFAAVFERLKQVAGTLTEKELQLFEALVQIKDEGKQVATPVEKSEAE